MKLTPTKPIVGDWYDHPEYYDLSLRDETPLEAAFIEAACRKYCDFPVRRLLEPACGSGRLVVEMAARGYHVTGLDLNEKALDFLRKRLRRRKLRAEVLRADMTDFTLPQPADAAFCLLNSFRHLLSEAAARSHLEAVARNLRPGGIYILGLHLLPPDADENSIERWRSSQGKTQISTDLRVTGERPPPPHRDPADFATGPPRRKALAVPRQVRFPPVYGPAVPQALGQRAGL